MVDHLHSSQAVDDWIACKMIEIDHELVENRCDRAFYLMVELINELTHAEHRTEDTFEHVRFITDYYHRALQLHTAAAAATHSEKGRRHSLATRSLDR